MILTRHNTLIYLVNLGVLTVRDIATRAIEVHSHAQRNRGFSVRWRSAGVYVKQHRPDEGYWSTGSTVESEAALLQYFAGEAALNGLVATCRVFDRPYQIAVIDWLAEAAPLADRILAETGKSAPTTALLARRAKALHTALAGLSVDTERLRLNSDPPWALLFKRLLPVISEDQSRGQAKMVGLIQQQGDLMAGLADLAGNWPAVQIIHGDMKWQNCLITTTGDAGGSPGSGGETIVFIDWEMAMLGDPLWDLAGLSQSYIKAWLDGFHFGGGISRADVAQAMVASFPDCQERLAQLWSAYAGAPVAADETLRFSRLTGARLIQTIYEEASGEDEVQPQHIILLQFARNLVVGPGRGGEHLLLARAS